MADVTVIEMYPLWAECWACGADTPARWGLPISDNAELVSNYYDGEWSGLPACQQCYEAHAQGLLTQDMLVYWRRRMQLERCALTHLIVRE